MGIGCLGKVWGEGIRGYWTINHYLGYSFSCSRRDVGYFLSFFSFFSFFRLFLLLLFRFLALRNAHIGVFFGFNQVQWYQEHIHEYKSIKSTQHSCIKHTDSHSNVLRSQCTRERANIPTNWIMLHSWGSSDIWEHAACGIQGSICISTLETDWVSDVP